MESEAALIIGPSGTEYAASNSAGECGSMTLTIVPHALTIPETPSNGDNISLTDNLEIRQEMIWLINQARKANGIPEPSVNEALMNTAQICSSQRYTWGITPQREAKPLLM